MMFSLLISVLLHTAVADPDDLECSSPYVMFTSPTTNQIDVPLDTQPAVFMSSDECAAPSYYDLVLSTGDAVVKSARLDWERDGERLFELGLEDDLEPDTAYVLSLIAGDGWGELTEIHFTTGSAAVLGLEGRPGIELSPVTPEESWVVFDYLLSPAEDADDLSIIMVYDELDPDRVIAAHRVEEGGNAWISASRSVDPEREDLCLFVVQRDGAGNLSERSESACETIFNTPSEPETPSRCSVVYVGGVAWFMPVLALAAIRRRRSKESERSQG